MYLTGFADEAAVDIDGQIAATKELGWEFIEARNIDGCNLHDISEDKFKEVVDKLGEAGIKINCFGSTIANWQKSVDDSEESSLQETERAIERMKVLGTKLVRVMSYKVFEDRDPDDQMFEERIEKLTRIVNMFTQEGLTPLHENCMNYGGMSAEHTLQIIERIPGLKLVFDTGNPVFNPDRSKQKPWPRQSAWEFYDKVRASVAYIHIKDGNWTQGEDGEAHTEFTYAGEGQGDVKRIVKDALDTGFDGGISMEPHVASVFHDEDSSGSSKAEVMYSSYIEYGRRFEALLAEIGHPVSK